MRTLMLAAVLALAAGPAALAAPGAAPRTLAFRFCRDFAQALPVPQTVCGVDGMGWDGVGWAGSMDGWMDGWMDG